jgi:hypothetical protein
MKRGRHCDTDPAQSDVACTLRDVRPQLSPLEAADAAMDEFEEACDFDPEVAAAMYADDWSAE